jgi:DNA-binding transcriptional ArsR family regulator
MIVSCQPSDPECPAGGQHNVTTSESPAYNLSFSTYGYTRTSSNHMGMLSGSAQPRLIMVGGANLDVVVDGWVRLPIGGDSTPCSCGDWDGKTLGATGQIRLANLRYSDDRHLGAELSGEFASARLNEQPLDVAWLNSVQLTAGVAAAAIGLVVLAKLAKLLPSGFFTRQTRAAPLDNPRRKAIHDAVLAHPGISFRGLVRLTGQAIGTTQHHLAVLGRSGLIAKRRHGFTLRFFENHGRHDNVWRELATLQDPHLGALHEWLCLQPELPQQIILDAMQRRHHWPRSTTQHRLSRLEQGGLVQLRVAGRRRYYLGKTIHPLLTR